MGRKADKRIAREAAARARDAIAIPKVIAELRNDPDMAQVVAQLPPGVRVSFRIGGSKVWLDARTLEEVVDRSTDKGEVHG